MLNLNELIKKLTKRLSQDANTICIIEKHGSFFYHIAITSELCALLNIESELVANKSIADILDITTANRIRKHYIQAWNTQKDVFYKLDFPHGNEETLFKVLSPVVQNGKTVRLISHVVIAGQIPLKLRTIA